MTRSRLLPLSRYGRSVPVTVGAVREPPVLLSLVPLPFREGVRG